MALNYKYIRDNEVLNTLRVDFYKDGDQYYAFERSAWFVCVWLSPGRGYQISRPDGIPMVYCSVSEEELEKLLESVQGVTRTKEKVIVSAGIDFDIHAYYKWRDCKSVGRGPRYEPLPGGNRKLSAREMQRRYEELWGKVSSFDAENSTDAQCREFIEELKGLLGENEDAEERQEQRI